MDATWYEWLDKLAAAGDSGLKAPDITGKSRGTDKLLQPLIDDKLVRVEKKKYYLSPAGREAQQHSTEQRSDQQRRREYVAETAAILVFLRQIEAKGGKLSAGQLGKIPESVREAARERGLIDAGPKANTFVLRPAAEQMLLADLPLDDFIARQRATLEQQRQSWTATRKELDEQLARVGAVAEEQTADLTAAARSALESFESVYLALGAAPAIVGLSDRLRAQIHRDGDSIRDRVVADTSELIGEMDRLRRALTELANTDSMLHDVIDARLTKLASMAPTVKVDAEERTNVSADSDNVKAKDAL